MTDCLKVAFQHTCAWYDGPRVIFVEDEKGDYWFGCEISDLEYPQFTMVLAPLPIDKIEDFASDRLQVRELYPAAPICMLLDLNKNENVMYPFSTACALKGIDYETAPESYGLCCSELDIEASFLRSLIKTDQ